MYQFPALANTVHAAFTRLGGRSQSPWYGLNLSQAVGDETRAVETNFKLACQALAVNPERTAACHLVHGNVVQVVEDVAGPYRLGVADGLITRVPGLTLTMRFGDCVPLLFYDHRIQAVGLAHAGWRGTLKNVAGAVVEAMTAHFGSRPSDITAVIGPSIGPCCYQVGREVLEAAQQQLEQAIQYFNLLGPDCYFDLWRVNESQARQTGVKEVIVSRLCTACRTDEFFSHRAEKGSTGRFGVFLGLPIQEEGAE